MTMNPSSGNMLSEVMMFKKMDFSEITKSESKNRPSKSELSRFQNPTQMIKVDNFSRTWQIVASYGLDGAAEDKKIENHQVNIKNQAFQVRPIKSLKPNTDVQGGQLPPTLAPTLVD